MLIFIGALLGAQSQLRGSTYGDDVTDQ